MATLSLLELQPWPLRESDDAPTNPLLYLPPAPTRFPLHTRLVPQTESSSSSSSPVVTPRVLVVGDIHGCLDELKALVAAAGVDPAHGDTVIAVGDLVTKGPKSRQVIQWLMTNGYFSVLGNHDQLLLRNAMLAGRLDGHVYASDDEIKLWSAEEVAQADPSSELYARTYYARMNGFHLPADRASEHYKVAQSLSDEELAWVSRLPLTIDLVSTFPVSPSSTSAIAGAMPRPWTVVHAGLVPDLALHRQHPFFITTMRNWDPVTKQPSELIDVGSAWSMQLAQPIMPAAVSAATAATAGAPVAGAATCAASLAPDARYIVFGHDAPRGFQHPNSQRLGLDTAACNGRFLSGLLLPDNRVWNVPSAAVYTKQNNNMSEFKAPPTPPGIKLINTACEQPAQANAPTESNDVSSSSRHD